MKRYSLLIFAAIAMTSCDNEVTSAEEAFGPYKVLKQKYTNTINLESSTIDSLLLQNTQNSGLLSFDKTGKIALSPDHVFIELDIAYFGSLLIPSSNVSACSCVSFTDDRTYTELLLAEEGVKISVGYVDLAKQTIDWCFKEGIPLVSNLQQRSWINNKNPFPKLDDYEQVSKDKYYEQYKSACQGY